MGIFQKLALQGALGAMHRIAADKKVISTNGQTAIAIDEVNQKICLFDGKLIRAQTKPNQSKRRQALLLAKAHGLDSRINEIKKMMHEQGMSLYDAKKALDNKYLALVESNALAPISAPEPLKGTIIDYADIISAEIIENGNTLTTSHALGGAVAGELLFGGVGAIVGALSASKRSSQIATSIDLKIMVNDTTRPIWIIGFLDRPKKKSSSAYRQSLQKAFHWQGLLTVLAKRAAG